MSYMVNCHGCTDNFESHNRSKAELDEVNARMFFLSQRRRDAVFKITVCFSGSFTQRQQQLSFLNFLISHFLTFLLSKLLICIIWL